MSSLQAKLQHKYALSEKGAKDMIKAFVSVTCSDLVLMFPVWMLYFLVRDYLQGTMAGRGVFYIVGCVLCLLLIALTTLVQYRATFLATYVESGVRRIVSFHARTPSSYVEISAIKIASGYLVLTSVIN